MIESENDERKILELLRENGPKTTAKIIEHLGSEKRAYVILALLHGRGLVIFMTAGTWKLVDRPLAKE